MSQVIVLAEQKGGALVNATLSAIGAAKEIAAIVGGGFDIAIAGADVGGGGPVDDPGADGRRPLPAQRLVPFLNTELE